MALGDQAHHLMLLSAALRLSAAPTPMCLEVRPEPKMQSVQRYFDSDLILNPRYGKLKKRLACNNVL